MFSASRPIHGMPAALACLAVAAALAVGLALALPATARAGVACTLLVNTDGDPPATDTFAEVEENVHISGTFLADAEVTLTFSHTGVPDDVFVVTAAADGTISLDGHFEVDDAGFWTIQADDGSCQAEAFVTVTPVGDYTSVSVTSLVCPPEIQTAEDLAEDPDACILALHPADEPDFPDGHTGPELALIDFDYLLVGADGAERDIGFAEGSGGGACDPVEQTCTFGWSYEWSFSALGATQLIGSGFEGYRLGAVEVFDGLDPVAPTEVDLDGGSVTWNLDGPGTESARFYWFAPPEPAPSQGGEDELPDTAAGEVERSLPIGVAVLSVAALLWLALVPRRGLAVK